MIRQFSIAFAAALSLGLSLSVSAQNTIEKLAPENTVLIIGARNVQTMTSHVKETGLWSLWQSDKLKSMRAEAMKKMDEGLKQMFQELGVDDDSLVPPSGPAGLALFAITDKETGMPQLAVLMFADYGDAAGADKTDKLVLAALEKGEKDHQVEFDKKDIGGRTVYSIDMTKIQEKEEHAMEGAEVGGGMIPLPKPDKFMKGMNKMNYVRDGNSLLLCSNFDSLATALDAAGGKAPADGGLANRKDFQAVTGKLGESDAYAVLLTRDIMDILSSFDDSGMIGMFQPMTRALVGEVKGYGFGAKFGGSTTMLEQTIAVYMPGGKQGLTTLIDTQTPRGSLPSFAGADAVSYSSFNFDFGKLVDVVHKIVTSNSMLNMQLGQQLPEIEQTMNQVMSTLGNNIQTVTSVSKPYTATSHRSVFAIQCPKPQEFENAVGNLLGQAGIQPRDFLGQRIYTLDPAMLGGMMPGMPGGEMQPMSLGIGGGFVFIGVTPAVEQSLRATSQPGAAALAADADFLHAVSVLPQEPAVAWGFSDTIESAQAMIAAQKAQMEKSIEEMRKEDPELADEMKANLKDAGGMFDSIDFDLLRKYIGPSAWHLRSNEDGFLAKFYLLGTKN